MARRVFPVYDFAVFGIKGMLKHFRLFILTTLGFVATMIATAGLLAIPFYRLIQRMIDAGMDLKYDMMTCVNKQECIGAFGRLCQKVCPMASQFTVMFVVVSIVLFIVMIWLGTGMLRILLQLVDKDKSSARELWGTFRFVPRFFVAGIFFLIAVSIGFALFVIPGIWLTLRLFFWKFYIVDKDMGIFECMRASFHATRGIEWDLLALLILGLTFIAINPILGLPVFALMTTAAYRKVQK